MHRVRSGTAAFEWTLRDAYVQRPGGERVIDVADSPLHVVNCSTPVRRRMTLGELRSHLHALPDHPDWIPYRAAYYRESWGFCLTHRALQSLPDGEHDVVIDSLLADGTLDYAGCVIPGETSDEVLTSTYAYHPFMRNDAPFRVLNCSDGRHSLLDVAELGVARCR